MRDPLTMLRAVPAPAESSAAREHALQRLQARIDAPARPPRRVRRPQIMRVAALGVVAAAAVAVGVSVLPSSGGNTTIDLLGKAAAAYAPRPQRILYQRTTTREFGRRYSNGAPVQQVTREEDWSLLGVGFRILSSDGRGRVILDESVSRTRRRQYTAGRPFIDEPRSKNGEPVDVSSNPFTNLLAAAKKGQLTLRRDGTRRIDGHLTDKLVFIDARATAGRTRDVIYVHHVTQLPVRLVSHYPPGYGDTGLGGTIAMAVHRSETDFEAVEELPDTAVNRKLLELPEHHER
jgi:hypothetical protein